MPIWRQLVRKPPKPIEKGNANKVLAPIDVRNMVRFKGTPERGWYETLDPSKFSHLEGQRLAIQVLQRVTQATE
jgi:hypothetical protein